MKLTDWYHPDSHRKKFVSMLHKIMMAIVFWDQKEIIVYEFISNATIKSNSDVSKLSKFWEKLVSARLNLKMSDIFLLQSDKSLKTRKATAVRQSSLITQCFDLVPTNFHLFGSTNESCEMSIHILNQRWNTTI